MAPFAFSYGATIRGEIYMHILYVFCKISRRQLYFYMGRNIFRANLLRILPFWEAKIRTGIVPTRLACEETRAASEFRRRIVRRRMDSKPPALGPFVPQ